MQVQNIQYQTAASGGPFAVSSFSLAAPNLQDLSPGDLTTGYQNTANPSGGVIAALIDLGASGLTAVNQFRASLYTTCGDSVILYSSPDGVTWTAQQTLSGQGGSGGPSAIQPATFTGVTARYWQLLVTNSTTGSYTAGLYDFRLYASGSLISPYVAPPLAPGALSLGATTAGGSSLPINTQALTTNATSENVLIGTDPAFVTNTTTIAVPTPGTAVTANGLVSGTVYYACLQMVGAGGNVNGPATTVRFDTTGPTFPAGSAVISASGLVLTITASEFSPPLSALLPAQITLAMSGGAAALSGFSVSGNVFTAAISRAVGSTETGTVTIPAGTFGDSAVPTTNTNAAVAAYAVVNGSSLYVAPRVAGIERATLFQGLQIGVESLLTPGTIVPATKRLISLQVDPEPIIPVKTYRPYGVKSMTATQAGQEMTESNLTGVMCFNTMLYLLASQIGVPPAPVALGGGAYQWNLALNEVLPAQPQTYSCEVGSVQGLSKFGYGFIPDLELTGAKEEASIGGKIQGQQLLDNMTQTFGVAELPVVAFPTKLMRVSLGATAASLTKLTRIISAKVTLNAHWVPQFFRDDGQISFSGLAEKAPDYMFEIVNEINSDTDTMLAALRNDTIVYLQLQYTGPYIATVGGLNIYYLFQITMPVKVQAQPTREDHDAVYGSTFKFVGAHDPVFGAVQATLINKLASL